MDIFWTGSHGASSYSTLAFVHQMHALHRTTRGTPKPLADSITRPHASTTQPNEAQARGSGQAPAQLQDEFLVLPRSGGGHPSPDPRSHGVHATGRFLWRLFREQNYQPCCCSRSQQSGSRYQHANTEDDSCSSSTDERCNHQAP